MKTENNDAFYAISLALVAGALLLALLVAIGIMAVHSVESLLDRKRSVASLAALGVPLDELESAQRWEARLVAMPMAAVGALLGSGAIIVVSDRVAPLALLVILANVVITLALVRLAIVAAVRVIRRWTVAAASVTHLRTE